jgi:hypothetical protein
MIALTYNAHGITFQYAPGLRVSTFARPGRGTNIKVEGTGLHGHMFGVVMMTYIDPVSPEKAVADAVAGMELIYEEPPTKILKRESCARRIAGAERSGQRFDIQWDNNPRIELYAFVLKERTLCVSLQYDADDAEKAVSLFGPVLESLA